MKSLIATALLAAFGVAHGATLFDNGAYLNSGNLSVLTSPDTTYGVGASATANNSLAENFSLASNSVLSSLTVFAYQTGSTTTSTFTGGSYAIYSGAPTDLTTGLVAGGLSTPATFTTAFTGNYRVLSTNQTDTNRPIMSITMDLGGLNLPAGNYYVAYRLSGSLASGPFVPPTVTTTEGGVLQSLNGGAFAPVTDGGSGRALSVPFVISGTQAVPEPATMAVLGLGAAALLRRRKRA